LRGGWAFAIGKRAEFALEAARVAAFINYGEINQRDKIEFIIDKLMLEYSIKE